jgi:hypothetical protein
MPEDADRDFLEHCPRAAAWIRARFRPAARFGAVRVWLREDVYARNRVRLARPAEAE